MIIQSKNIWLEEKFQAAQIEIINNKIMDIYRYQEKIPDVDYGELNIIPGLIDIHDHGYNGSGANYGDLDYFKEWCAYLPSEGVTSFYPTTSTIPLEDLYLSFQRLANAIENPSKGAQMLGIHTEGIIISEDKKGAHDPELLVKPTIDLFKKWQQEAKNHIKMMSIAPEIDENHETIKYAINNNVVVSLAHTNATYEETIRAIKNGAMNMTHTFNAMRGIHHREPGVAGAALSRDDVYAELICDGHHVNFAVGKILGRSKGKDKVIAITDAVPTKGLKPGIYGKKGTKYKVIVEEDGSSRLEDGTISGSSARMIDMVKNLNKEMNLPIELAINSATINPAKLFGIDDYKGLLKPGHDADLTIINEDFEVLSTYVLGEEVYRKEKN